jgi:acetyl-CoA C-acetyltransferase
MLYECWLQLRGEAPPERRIATVASGRALALTHDHAMTATDRERAD